MFEYVTIELYGCSLGSGLESVGSRRRVGFSCFVSIQGFKSS